MPIENEERERILGLLEVERLQSEGMTAIEQGRNANSIADRLLALSRQTSDDLVSDMARRAHAGIASAQLSTAAATLATVNDRIATATKAFSLAARIAQEGEADLTFPFVAGKAASLLDFLKSLQKTVIDTRTEVESADSIVELLEAFESAKSSVSVLRERAEQLAG
jgi:hypothetical protein